jgi:crossover junction endodeoxyribonuclease RuvC
MEHSSYYNSGKKIAGIDPSLRSTGVVIINDKGEIIEQKLLINKSIKGADRLIKIRDEVAEILERNKVDIVAIEGFSFGSFGRSVFDLGGLGWILRVLLKEKNYNIFDISPSSLKSFIVKGNADKNMMMETVNHVYGISFSDDNLCDAFALCRMVLALGENTAKFSEKGGAQKIKRLRENLRKAGLDLK